MTTPLDTQLKTLDDQLQTTINQVRNCVAEKWIQDIDVKINATKTAVLSILHPDADPTTLTPTTDRDYRLLTLVIMEHETLWKFRQDCSSLKKNVEELKLQLADKTAELTTKTGGLERSQEALKETLNKNHYGNYALCFLAGAVCVTAVNRFFRSAS